MWSKLVTLPIAGLTVPVDDETASVTPIAQGGVRIKWRKHDARREVRIGAEAFTGAAGFRAHVDATVEEFDGTVVASTDLSDPDVLFPMLIIRERDARRHVILGARRIDDRRMLQASIECTGADPSEVRDEWTVFESLLNEVVEGEPVDTDTDEEHGHQLVVSPVNRSIGLTFDLPPGVYIADVAYGMEQIQWSRRRPAGRIVYGGLAARGAKRCAAAFAALADDPGVFGAEIATDRDDLTWVRATIADRSTPDARLIVVGRSVRGISLVVGALALDDEDDDIVTGVLRHAAITAERLAERGDGAPSRSLVDVLSKMDTFRKRLDGRGHRVAGG